jgi:prepilin-type processing-associated H-X9-DG protein
LKSRNTLRSTTQERSGVVLRGKHTPTRFHPDRIARRDRDHRTQSGNIGHTIWVYGNSVYDGFTTALPPNPKALVAPGVDVDVNTEDENNGGPTYAAITARSYHPGGVDALFCDGSVHFIKNSIAWTTWRQLGTIAGGEVVSSDSY